MECKRLRGVMKRKWDFGGLGGNKVGILFFGFGGLLEKFVWGKVIRGEGLLGKVWVKLRWCGSRGRMDGWSG